MGKQNRCNNKKASSTFRLFSLDLKPDHGGENFVISRPQKTTRVQPMNGETDSLLGSSSLCLISDRGQEREVLFSQRKALFFSLCLSSNRKFGWFSCSTRSISAKLGSLLQYTKILPVRINKKFLLELFLSTEIFFCFVRAKSELFEIKALRKIGFPSSSKTAKML